MPLPRLLWFTSRFPWLEPVGASMAQLVRPLLATSLLVTGATLGMRYAGWLEFAELAAYDHFIQRQPDRGPDDRLLVVGINESDLQTLKEWPVSDRSLAQALVRLQALDPAVIAVDVIRDFPQEPGHTELMQQFAQHPNILATCKVSSANDLGIPPPATVAHEQVGFADLVIDPGGILRRSLLLVTPPKPSTPFPKQHICNDYSTTLLSFGLRSTLLYLQGLGLEAGFTETNQLQLGDTVIPAITADTGGYRQADTAGYQVLLRYRSATQPVAQVSLVEAIRGQVDPALVRGRIVMIGYTTPQSKDDFYTPFSSTRDDQQKMPGVIVHAQAASQLLSTVLDDEPLIWVWPQTREILWIIGWSVVGGVLGWSLRHPVAFGLAIGAGLGGLYAISLGFFSQNGWIPIVPPAITFMGTAVGVVLLDRFNNSAYGQQVYHKVKTLLHLDIEIDEEKLEQQVAEITESDYFRDLQDTVKTLRGASDTPLPELPTAKPSPSRPLTRHDDDDDLAALLAPEPALPTHSNSPHRSRPQEEDGLSFLNDLNQTAQQLKRSLKAEHPDHAPLSTAPNALESLAIESPRSANDTSLDFLEDLSQSSRRIKHAFQAKSSAAIPYPLIVDDRDDAFCRCYDTSEATRRYVDYIAQEIQALKRSIHEQV